MSKTIEEWIGELETKIQKEEKNVKQLENLENLKHIAQQYRGEDQLVSSRQLAEIMKTRPPEFTMLTGWKQFDAILKGFRLHQVVTIAAPTKSGKTSFCIDLTSRLKDHSPMWLPFEEGAEELIQKFIDRNELPPEFFTPEHITGNTLFWVEKKIIESIAKYNTKIIFIDHLHFIVPFTAERTDLKIGETMRTLKKMAKKWNVTIVLIAHLKKTRLDTQPDLEDLRDSSFIAQESDTVIMLWRETRRDSGKVVITNNVNVSVQANRRTGKTGNVKMKFDEGRFTEFEWVSDMEISAQADRDWARDI